MADVGWGLRWLLGGLFVAAACTAENPTHFGDLGGKCFPNGTCNSGLVCVVEVDVCISAADLASAPDLLVPSDLAPPTSDLSVIEDLVSPDLSMLEPDLRPTVDLTPRSLDFGPVDPSCTQTRVQAKLETVDLVFLLDRSGSMGDGINGDPVEKWNPVTTALKQFFSDSASKGLRASLEFFPADADICNSSSYYFPATALTALPDTSFSTAIDATTPLGERPTLPAIIGTIDHAVDSLPTTPSARTAIILVTDGLPASCESTVANVSIECANVRSDHDILTYVIAVGGNLGGLTDIAVEGGTTEPMTVSVGDPDKTGSEFLAALEQLRSSTLSCSFSIPMLPANDLNTAIDFAKINVEYTPAIGSSFTLPRSADCSFGSGWRYDSPSAPTKIELCPSLCNAIRNDDSGQLNVVFGCETITF